MKASQALDVGSIPITRSKNFFEIFPRGKRGFPLRRVLRAVLRDTSDRTALGTEPPSYREGSLSGKRGAPSFPRALFLPLWMAGDGATTWQRRHIFEHMKQIISRKIFIIPVMALIIFLTGCADKEYHNRVSSVPPPPAGGLQCAQGFESSLYQNFIWPIRGNVVVPFGSKEDGVSIKGIVIESQEGQSVVAARDGRVSFVDEKLKGYGKTVILEHAGGYSTVYARNSEICVTLGQQVRQGEVIAKVGRAGRGNLPQLYFELRRKTRAENPVSYLVK